MENATKKCLLSMLSLPVVSAVALSIAYSGKKTGSEEHLPDSVAPSIQTVIRSPDSGYLFDFPESYAVKEEESFLFQLESSLPIDFYSKFSRVNNSDKRELLRHVTRSYSGSRPYTGLNFKKV